MVETMDGDHALKSCDIFHYNRFLLWFLSYSSFSRDDHKPLGWFYFVMWNSFPSEPRSYYLRCSYSWEKNIMKRQAQMCWMVRLHISQPWPFLTPLPRQIYCSAFTRGQTERAPEVCKLTQLFSVVKSRAWDWGWRKESPRVSLAAALHVALHRHCLLLCLAKKIWAIPSLSLRIQGAHAAFPLNPAHRVHILPSPTLLLLLVKIAWHTCRCSYT